MKAFGIVYSFTLLINYSTEFNVFFNSSSKTKLFNSLVSHKITKIMDLLLSSNMYQKVCNGKLSLEYPMNTYSEYDELGSLLSHIMSLII